MAGGFWHCNTLGTLKVRALKVKGKVRIRGQRHKGTEGQRDKKKKSLRGVKRRGNLIDFVARRFIGKNKNAR